MGEAESSRTGFIAIVGRPNVGKSTLLNALVGEHVSITARRPQTTRSRVLGVLTRGAAPAITQFIFVDTPGLQQRTRTLLQRRMNETVRATLAEVDAVVMVIDARGWKSADDEVLSLLPRERANVVLALNKTDLLPRYDLVLPVLADCARRYPFTALVPVSAEKRGQLDELLDEIALLLPPGQPLFDADAVTDRSVRFLAAEIVREKAFRLLGDEVPYGIAVAIERWQETAQRAQIVAAILVEREAHKPIVIGAGGAKLREIGRLARADIEALLGKRVYLQTWVRVKPRWSDDAGALRALGYE
ncbi:MAG: GTPase Era [Sutterellaceae bacterium]|nr:GTPase Era [Burkholderiaceae bacterium]MCX7901996.1 GTPase Era [Burkholderiaceae bacterium]MDW8429810.1 GTPase Era [Sutterellaceae bacterium]